MNEVSQNILLKVSNISKQYPGVKALDDVSLEVRRGEIHALVGENGAGKSTFVNVMGGVVKPDKGQILLDGKEVQFLTPRHAADAGIAVVHQELSLFPNLNIATNLFLSNLEGTGLAFIPDKRIEAESRELLKRVGLEGVSPVRKVERLQPGEQQLVEIARAIVKESKLIVLDEPTSSLAEKEIRTLFRIVRELRDQGVSIIFVSHRLDEVFELCDRVTVFRDGQHIVTSDTSDLSSEQLVNLILGRKLNEMYFSPEEGHQGEELLRVERLRQLPKLQEITFSLYRGEILGVAGLLGSGRSELVRSIFGLESMEQGLVYLKGNRVTIQNPEQAIKHGIGYITEDRHKEGLMLEKSVKDNIVLANLKKLAGKLGWMKSLLERQAAEMQRKDLNIVTPSIQRKVKFLSGGNQQKVVLGKWLETSPEIYILDEPTRGIDVGAKAEFYKIIRSLAEQGAGVLLISSDLQEIVGICHRVLVLRNGRFITEYSGHQIDPAAVLMKMTGENNGK
ncbi:MAG: sugar ABC transporter ATP-binding protein [Anaerolineales bacterium]|nr:sugar ABC transporter ATP-binding protein [Anaerolineales bacterium]